MTQRRRRLLLTLLWAAALLSGSLVMGDVLRAGREERANRQLADQVRGREARRRGKRDRQSTRPPGCCISMTRCGSRIPTWRVG